MLVLVPPYCGGVATALWSKAAAAAAVGSRSYPLYPSVVCGCGCCGCVMVDHLWDYNYYYVYNYYY